MYFFCKCMISTLAFTFNAYIGENELNSFGWFYLTDFNSHIKVFLFFICKSSRSTFVMRLSNGKQARKKTRKKKTWKFVSLPSRLIACVQMKCYLKLRVRLESKRKKKKKRIHDTFGCFRLIWTEWSEFCVCVVIRKTGFTFDIKFSWHRIKIPPYAPLPTETQSLALAFSSFTACVFNTRVYLPLPNICEHRRVADARALQIPK